MLVKFCPNVILSNFTDPLVTVNDTKLFLENYIFLNFVELSRK